MFKRFSTFSYILSAFILLFAGVLVANGAWNPPTGTAPAGNTPEPINISNSAQLKTGSFGVSVLDVSSSGFVDKLGIGITNISELLGKLTVGGGDIVISKPTVSPSTGYKLVLHSWSDTMSTDWKNISELNLTQWQSAVDNCNNNKSNKFQCSAATNPDGYSCADVYKETVSGNTAYYSATAVCSGSDSKYSLRTSGGILQFLNNADENKLSIDQSGNLNAIGKITAGQFQFGTPGAIGDVLTATDVNGNSAWQSISQVIQNYYSTTTFIGGTGGPNYWNLSGNNLTASSTDFNVGIGTTNTQNKLSVQGSFGLLREPGTSITPGPGPQISLQSPSSDTTTSRSSWTQCGSAGQPICPSDTTPGNSVTLAYSCPNGSGGNTYVDVSVITNTTQKVFSSIVCVSGTSAYSLRTNNGTLEFLKSNGNSTSMSLDQDGNLVAVSSVTTGNLIGNGLTVSGTSNLSGDVNVLNGKLKTDQFQLGTSAVDGQVLTTDASGNGTWKALPAGTGGGGTYGIIANAGLQLSSNNFGLQSCAAGKILKVGTAGWVCANDQTTGGGSGISYTGDNGINVDAASDVISINSCSVGEILKIGTNGRWGCASDQNGGGTSILYGSGKGISIDSATHAISVNSNGCVNGQVLQWNGTDWICSTVSGGTGGGGTTTSGVNYWNLSGNSLTASSTDFNVGIGTTNTQNKLSVQGSFGLLREPGTSITPGPGPQISLQSPSSDTTTSRSSWMQCGGIGQQTCPSDTTPGNSVTSAYSCPSGSGGNPYVDVSVIANSNPVQMEYSSITCVSGTSAYSLRTNNGTLEFLKSNGNSVNMLLDQSGNLVAVSSVTAGNLIGNGLTISGTSNLSGNLNVSNGKIKTDQFQLGSASTTAGYVLTADVNGVATWQALPASVSGGAASQWVTSGNDIYYNAGNVGIGTGTNTPYSKLEVNGDISMPYNSKIMLGNGAGGYGEYIQNSFADGRGVYGLSFIAGATGEKMRITGAGNIGINNSNPSYKLDVNGVASFGGGSGNLGAGAGISLAPLQNSGKSLIGWNLTGGVGEMDFINNRGGGSGGGFNFYDYSNAGVVANLVNITGTGNLLVSGNVGIGTSDPKYALHVIGSVKVQGVSQSDLPTIYLGNKTNDLGNWTNCESQNPISCNGASKSAGDFSLNDGSAPSALIPSCSDNNYSNSLYGYFTSPLTGVKSYQYRTYTCYKSASPTYAIKNDAGSLKFNSGINGTDTNVIITQLGNVGIGTTSPDGKLDVMDTIAGLTTGLRFSSWHTPGVSAGGMIDSYDDGGTVRSLILQNNGGSVGIGTTSISAGYKLEVAGAVKATQFSTGDLVFNHNGRPVWVMDEDENGLYAKSPITGKHYKISMEEIK